MAVEVQDILSIDAVFAELELLRNNDEVAACSAALGSEIITEVGLVLVASRGTPIEGRRLQVPAGPHAHGGLCPQDAGGTGVPC